MLECAFVLLMKTLLLMLRLSPADSFPKPLSKEEEREYLERWQAGDIDARNTLVEHNLRLVAHIIKKYYQNEDIDDLISIGTIGLIKAVSTFDCDKNIRFATYASRCIENEILMYFRSLKKTQMEFSLDEPLETDKDGNTLSMSDLIAEDDGIVEKIDVIIKSEQLYRFIGECLDERELAVITHRYGLFGHKPLTQREVAEKLDISRSYVSRIEKKALEELKKRYDRA